MGYEFHRTGSADFLAVWQDLGGHRSRKKRTGLGRGGRGESEKTPALQIGFY